MVFRFVDLELEKRGFADVCGSNFWPPFEPQVTPPAGNGGTCGSAHARRRRRSSGGGAAPTPAPPLSPRRSCLRSPRHSRTPFELVECDAAPARTPRRAPSKKSPKATRLAALAAAARGFVAVAVAPAGAGKQMPPQLPRRGSEEVSPAEALALARDGDGGGKPTLAALVPPEAPFCEKESGIAAAMRAVAKGRRRAGRLGQHRAALQAKCFHQMPFTAVGKAAGATAARPVEKPERAKEGGPQMVLFTRLSEETAFGGQAPAFNTRRAFTLSRKSIGLSTWEYVELEAQFLALTGGRHYLLPGQLDERDRASLGGQLLLPHLADDAGAAAKLSSTGYLTILDVLGVLFPKVPVGRLNSCFREGTSFRSAPLEQRYPPEVLAEMRTLFDWFVRNSGGGEGSGRRTPQLTAQALHELLPDVGAEELLEYLPKQAPAPQALSMRASPSRHRLDRLGGSVRKERTRGDLLVSSQGQFQTLATATVASSFFSGGAGLTSSSIKAAAAHRAKERVRSPTGAEAGPAAEGQVAAGGPQGAPAPASGKFEVGDEVSSEVDSGEEEVCSPAAPARQKAVAFGAELSKQKPSLPEDSIDFAGFVEIVKHNYRPWSMVDCLR